MTLSKTKDNPLGSRRKLSDGHAFDDYSASSSLDCTIKTSTSANNKNNDDVNVSPKFNHPPQSPPSGRMTPVKKHRHHHGNRPRSKSESEALHHRSYSSLMKKRTNSPAGYYNHSMQSQSHFKGITSPTSVSPSSTTQKRSLGKMWIRPVSVKSHQNQFTDQKQQGSVPTMPFLPDFACQSSPFPGKDRHEDTMMLHQTSNSAFEGFQYSSAELSSHLPPKKLAFAFGASGKPLKPQLARFMLHQ